MFIGHQKGKNLAERTACNFGCAHPEGYRKALVKMRLAAKFGLPIVTFIDTPGAYPGIAAEERGQAAAANFVSGYETMPVTFTPSTPVGASA